MVVQTVALGPVACEAGSVALSQLACAGAEDKLYRGYVPGWW